MSSTIPAYQREYRPTSTQHQSEGKTKDKSAASTDQQVEKTLPTKWENHQKNPKQRYPTVQKKKKNSTETNRPEGEPMKNTRDQQVQASTKIEQTSPAPTSDATPTTMKDTTIVHNQQGQKNLTPHGSACNLNTNTVVRNDRTQLNQNKN